MVLRFRLKWLRWSRGSVLAFSTQVRGFKPGWSRQIFKGKKILSTPSFGGEVKPSVPFRRFAACKRSLNVAWKSTFRQNYRTTFSPTVPTSAAGISHVVADVEAPGGEKWERLKKKRGKQWQATPKNLPRMQRTRAIPVAWLHSGLCPDRPKGWIPLIIYIYSLRFSNSSPEWKILGAPMDGTVYIFTAWCQLQLQNRSMTLMKYPACY